MSNFRRLTGSDSFGVVVNLDLVTYAFHSSSGARICFTDGGCVDVREPLDSIFFADWSNPDSLVACHLLSGLGRRALKLAGMSDATPRQVAEAGQVHFAKERGISVGMLYELTTWIRRFGIDWKN